MAEKFERKKSAKSTDQALCAVCRRETNPDCPIEGNVASFGFVPNKVKISPCVEHSRLADELTTGESWWLPSPRPHDLCSGYWLADIAKKRRGVTWFDLDGSRRLQFFVWERADGVL